MWIKLKKIVLLVFVFLLFSTAVVVRFVSPVVSQEAIYETIYIRADGSVDPPTANITSLDNVTYTFTTDIYATIGVERDNIVVDGANFTLKGIGVVLSEGIDLRGRSNVTIRNMEIRDFYMGIYLYSSPNNNLSRNSITGNGYGIWLDGSSYNNVSVNNIKNNGYGIWFNGSSYNNVSVNNIANNVYGIWLSGSPRNLFRNNDVSNREYNFGVFGLSPEEFIQDIDDSNTVNGKPVYYWVYRRDMAVPLDAGWVALIGCTRITVKDLNLTDNGQGILLAYTEDSTITKNNIANNIYGIWVLGSSNNTINENNITENGDGIYIYQSSNNSINENSITENAGNGIYIYQSSNNLFFHNNFINNNRQGSIPTSGYANFWDNGVEGNYWSNYEDRYPNATELDNSGIWDTPYVIDENNQDNYPLMHYLDPPLISIVSPENNTYTVSNVSLTFTVSEPTLWIGYSLDGQAIVKISGNTTLTGLSDGLHSLKVYAKDTDGNTGTSETVHFSIKTQQPFPITWIVAIIAIIVAVGVALLVYFVKVKKTTGKAE